MGWDLIRSLLAIPKTRDPEEIRAQWRDASAVEAKVKEVVAEALGRDLEEVTLEMNTYDEGDSVGNLEVIMLLEETFAIKVPDEAAQHLMTVSQMVVYTLTALGLKPG